MNPLASQTITNLPPEDVYHTLHTTLPDGTVVTQLCQRVRRADGTEGWELTDHRLAVAELERKAFEQRFADTETQPNDWKPPSTHTMQPKTKEDLAKALLMTLGDPERIIAQKDIDRDKRERIQPAFLSVLAMMARRAGGAWPEAATYFREQHPEVTHGL